MRIDHDTHEDAAKVSCAQDIGRSLTQRWRKRIESGRSHGSHDLEWRHETGSRKRRLRTGRCGRQRKECECECAGPEYAYPHGYASLRIGRNVSAHYPDDTRK
jgi:hypothetical protein